MYKKIELAIATPLFLIFYSPLVNAQTSVKTAELNFFSCSRQIKGEAIPGGLKGAAENGDRAAEALMSMLSLLPNIQTGMDAKVKYDEVRCVDLSGKVSPGTSKGKTINFKCHLSDSAGGNSYPIEMRAIDIKHAVNTLSVLMSYEVLKFSPIDKASCTDGEEILSSKDLHDIYCKISSRRNIPDPFTFKEVKEGEIRNYKLKALDAKDAVITLASFQQGDTTLRSECSDSPPLVEGGDRKQQPIKVSH